MIEPAALAALDEQISEMTRRAAQYQKAMDGRSAVMLATQRVAWQHPAVQEALKPQPSGGIAGPWVVFLCPRGHKLVPARLTHDGGPDDGGGLVLASGARKGAHKKAELDSPQTGDARPWLNTRDQWRCVLQSCDWPGRAYRPEHLLRMHVAALVAGLDSIPLEPLAPRARGHRR